MKSVRLIHNLSFFLFLVQIHKLSITRFKFKCIIYSRTFINIHFLIKIWRLHYVRVIMSFTKQYIFLSSHFPFTFTHTKQLKKSFHFPHTFIPSTIFPFTLFLFTFFSHPNKANMLRKCEKARKGWNIKKDGMLKNKYKKIKTKMKFIKDKDGNCRFKSSFSFTKKKSDLLYTTCVSRWYNLQDFWWMSWWIFFEEAKMK